MDVMKFKIQSTWFGLRQRLMMQVYPDPVSGEPEPYWIEASQHNLDLLANRLQRLQEDNKTLHSQARERQRKDRENPRRTLPMTLKELSVSVMDAVDRALSTNPLLRATHDKLFPLAAGEPAADGQAVPITQLKSRVTDPEQASPYKPWLFPKSVCTGGFVPYKEPGLVGEQTEDHHLPASRLNAKVDICSNAPGGPVFNVTLLSEATPSEVAESVEKQIRACLRDANQKLGNPPPKD